MRGDGAAIERRSGFYAAMSFAVSFHHSPSALGRYYLNRAAIARGLMNYAAMALSPHFGLFRWFKFTLKPPYSIAHDKL